MPVYQHLYDVFRQAILSGELPAGCLLPSTQALAELIGVGRSTVVLAYEMLTSEGYLEGQRGSGTYVAQILPDTFTYTESTDVNAAGGSTRSDLSIRGMRMLDSRMVPPAPKRAFDTEEHASDLFPLPIWSALANRHFRSGARGWLEHGDAAGYLPLRKALAGYLRTSRAVACTPEQVIVFSGLVSAVTFMAQVLIDTGDPVWIQDPGWSHAAATFQLAGAGIVPVPIDDEGFDLVAGLAANPNARLAYVLPSCQYPFGTRMSMARRLVLLQWARETGGWIIENDYNGEFRYGGRPLPSLQGLDQHGRTLYLSTFSRTLFPSVRLAYVVVPEPLADQFVRARHVFDMYPPVFEQMVVADFISEGHFLRHIRRARRVHALRQAALLEAASTTLAGLLEIVPAESGAFLVGWLPDGVIEEAACRAAAEHGVNVDPLSLYYYRRNPDQRPGLVLGFADFSVPEIEDGLKRLAAALREVVV
jgi:GntR family transcriptional regulator/MocR family aminotransferase